MWAIQWQTRQQVFQITSGCAVPFPSAIAKDKDKHNDVKNIEFFVNPPRAHAYTRLSQLLLLCYLSVCNSCCGCFCRDVISVVVTGMQLLLVFGDEVFDTLCVCEYMCVYIRVCVCVCVFS